MLKFYVKVQTALQSLKDERGQDLIEYALLGALISVASIAAMNAVAVAIAAEFATITAAL